MTDPTKIDINDLPFKFVDELNKSVLHATENLSSQPEIAEYEGARCPSCDECFEDGDWTRFAVRDYGKYVSSMSDMYLIVHEDWGYTERDGYECGNGCVLIDGHKAVPVFGTLYECPSCETLYEDRDDAIGCCKSEDDDDD